MSPASPSDDLTAHAADWLARRDAGLSPAEQAEFDRWLARDPRHSDAVAELETAWAVVTRPRAIGRESQVLAQLELRARARRRQRQFGFAFGSLALAAAAAVAFLVPPRVPVPAAPAATAATAVATIQLRPDRQVLADGSVVELNAAAEIIVDFSPARRAVKLVRGEAHFAVAKDPGRPFVVSAGAVDVQAVGTEFSVGVAARQIEVLVTEGRVSVAHARPADATPDTPKLPPVLASAGARVTVAQAATHAAAPVLAPVTPAVVAQAQAWRAQRVEFSGTPLAEAIRHFNQQNRIQLALADPALGALRVSGVFWMDNPEGFARLVEASFRLRTTRRGTDRIELGR